jgi:hypothetical protein
MINPSRLHRSSGIVIDFKSGLGVSFNQVKIQMQSGMILTAALYDREMPKYKLELGMTVNFQSKFSIMSDGYIIIRIGSKAKVQLPFKLRLVA